MQRGGLPVHTPHFLLLVALRLEPGRARLGVVVTKKNGSAVVRNRIKRLCRECFRLLPDLLPERVDLVVIAKTGAHELHLADVTREWLGASRRLQAKCRELGAP